MNENPLHANTQSNLELEGYTDGPPELTRCQKCRVLCGCESLLVSLVVLFIGGSNFFIFFTYAGGFNREGLWVFFALGTLACLLVVWFIVRTCLALRVKRNRKKTEEKLEHKKDTKLVLALKAVVNRYNDLTDVNGKYYLAKMYASEMMEHIQQIYSAASSACYAFLGLELFHLRD